MPKVQLIRRDGGIIELDVTSIGFNVQRGVSVWPIPVFGVRAALDLNTNTFNINLQGILTDDEEATGANGAAAIIDLSRPTGIFDSWFKQQQAAGYSAIGDITSALHGKELVFRSAGQVSAGLGEDITLRFYSSSVPSATVATRSMIPVNISSSITDTGDIADAIVTALNGGSVKVNAATATISSIFTVAQSAGAKGNSGAHQSAGTLTNEKVTITNKTTGTDGNVPLLKRGDVGVSGAQSWTNSFFASANFNGGIDGTRLTRGDKVQDLLNSTVNASAGGGLISPQSFTGNLIEMPDSLSSFDVSSLLRIDQSESVKKYIVGLRIPYDSLASATGNSEELRQFIIPTGPGSNASAASNTESFDPVDTVGGESVRPNPFLRQGIAISGVVQTFDPAYEAGDSVWTYSLNFAAVEQLLGI